MSDQSHLDAKYFIDRHVYNCPYCNRNNLSYTLVHPLEFDWSNTKKCHIYFAVCSSCDKKSMHLSFNNLEVIGAGQQYKYRFKDAIGENIDDNFFYSVPTSFFSLDTRIPNILRELITESEGCLKSNYLTGASACVRKLIYELAILEKAEGNNYDERIKSLKNIRQDVDGEYFDTLLTIQQVTSDKVHEDSYDGWSSSHLRLILSTVIEILGLMYVIPELRKEKRQSILDLKDNILGKPKEQA